MWKVVQMYIQEENFDNFDLICDILPVIVIAVPCWLHLPNPAYYRSHCKCVYGTHCEHCSPPRVSYLTNNKHLECNVWYCYNIQTSQCWNASDETKQTTKEQIYLCIYMTITFHSLAYLHVINTLIQYKWDLSQFHHHFHLYIHDFRDPRFIVGYKKLLGEFEVCLLVTNRKQ